MSRPTCFFSYMHEGAAHQDWMLGLAQDLAANGIKVSLDHELELGADLTRYMEQSICEADFVVIVCTPAYAKRANKRLRGVGYETTIITKEIFNTAPQRKFIPLLRKGDYHESLPAYLGTRLAVDFRIDSEYEDALTRLVRHIWGQPPVAPPAIGDRPQFDEKFKALRAPRKRSLRRSATRKRTVPQKHTVPPEAKSEDTHPTPRHRPRSPEELRWARENYRSRLKTNESIFGPDHRITLADRYDWAKRIGRAGDPGEAARLYEKLGADFERIHGPTYRGSLASRRQQAHWSGEAGDLVTAIRLYTELLRYYTDLLGSDHRHTRHVEAARSRLEASVSRPARATAA